MNRQYPRHNPFLYAKHYGWKVSNQEEKINGSLVKFLDSEVISKESVTYKTVCLLMSILLNPEVIVLSQSRMVQLLDKMYRFTKEYVLMGILEDRRVD